MSTFDTDVETLCDLSERAADILDNTIKPHKECNRFHPGACKDGYGNGDGLAYGIRAVINRIRRTKQEPGNEDKINLEMNINK